MNWQVYWWKARKQFLIGDSRQIVNLCNESGTHFTRRYASYNRPKTLVHVCSLEEFKAKGVEICKTV